MRPLAAALAITALSATAALAQTATTTPTTTPNPAAPSGGVMTPPAATAPTVGSTHSMSGPAAASGDRNQAVATTSANAPAPAKGANSFTESQAQARLKDHGFGSVSGHQKDHDGIWRGHATKGGQQVSVWVDYKGNVGQQ